MSKDYGPMKHARALFVALTVVTLGGCASAGAPAETEAVDGIRPTETATTRAAGLHIVRAGMQEGAEAEGQYQQALEAALLAIEETPDNPKAYLLAGQAAVGLRDWERADTMFDRAEEMYPPYDEQIVSEREQGWVVAYNEGAVAMGEGDLDLALQMFQAADRLYQGRPEARVAMGSVYSSRGEVEEAAEAYLSALEIAEQNPPESADEEQAAEWEETRRAVALNAAQLLAQSGDYERAAGVLEGFLEDYADTLDSREELRLRTALAGFYAQAGDAERAESMYDDLLGRDDLGADEYFQTGIGFFNTGDYGRAAEVFARASELNPYSRDALLNLVQSLYSQALELEETEDSPEKEQELRSLYERTLEAAEQVQALDPLNRNLISFMLRSYRSLADLSSSAEAQTLNQTAQTLFREYQNQEYEVSDIQLRLATDDQLNVGGTLTNLAGTAGDEVQIRFEVLGSQGQVLDSTVMTVTSPDEGSDVQFSGTLQVPAGEYAGWRYAMVQ